MVDFLSNLVQSRGNIATKKITLQKRLLRENLSKISQAKTRRI